MTSVEYNLQERTAKFGEEIIIFSLSLQRNVISTPLISQVVRSGTSVGANYMEALGAVSKRDFINKIFISKKELQETKHWLRMLATAFPDKSEQIKPLIKEAQELTLIFQKIGATSRKNEN